MRPIAAVVRLRGRLEKEFGEEAVEGCRPEKEFSEEAAGGHRVEKELGQIAPIGRRVEKISARRRSGGGGLKTNSPASSPSSIRLVTR
jgi:hypothetical protein